MFLLFFSNLKFSASCVIVLMSTGSVEVAPCVQYSTVTPLQDTIVICVSLLFIVGTASGMEIKGARGQG